MPLIPIYLHKKHPKPNHQARQFLSRENKNGFVFVYITKKKWQKNGKQKKIKLDFGSIRKQIIYL